MTTESDTAASAFPTLEDWQHWTLVMGRAQQMLLESWADSWKAGEPAPGLHLPPAPDPMAMLTTGGVVSAATALATVTVTLDEVATLPAAS